MQKRLCLDTIKFLHPDHRLMLTALATELVKFLLDTREVNMEIKCIYPDSQVFRV